MDTFLEKKMWFRTFLILLLLMEFCLFEISRGDSSNWKSGPPDGLPQLNKLSVECGKEKMIIYLEFTAPYDGTIYSKSNGQSPRCIHIVPHSHVTEATFSINYHSCGTRSDSQGKYYENTIIIQYDDTVIEAWDEAKKIRCEWHDGYEKSAYKMPITISDLDVVEMNFQGDDVDCWLEVQDGKGPWSAKVEGLIPLGSPLTLVVAIQDGEGQFDMRVKSCIAHDGHKNPIHLTDDDGCILRPKMMSPFQKTSDTKGTASVIAYSHFYAFKFPETVEVTIQCTVEICRHGCPDTCLQGRDAHTSNPIDGYLPPQGKDKDDVPTYKDTHAFSTIITSKPGSLGSSPTVNTSINGTVSTHFNNTKNDDPDLLKASPDTHHDFYMDRYPYDLYDILESDDNKNEHDLYTDVGEEEYSDNRDNIYFSQMPNIYVSTNEQGKNFSPNQKIQNVSSDADSITQSSEISSTMHDINLGITQGDKKITLSHISDIEENITNIQVAATEHETTTGTENSNITNVLTENPINEDPILNDESQSYAKITQDHTVNQFFSSELFEDDSLDVKATERIEKSQTESEESKAKSLHELNTDRTVKSIQETDNNNNENSKYKDIIVNFEEVMKPTIKDTTKSKIIKKDFENLKIEARTPTDNDDMQHNLHSFNYKPFMPPAPVPPLTLYNGVPLYYYNHPHAKNDFFKRDAFDYMERQPYHKEYLKSKLRRPGTRRGRREIGEKEQLGLKQTLKVIATTDFDFLVKEDKKIEPLYVGKSETNNDVCIAPSSFAAGLGLLLLANICVLCVVIFLGHHYYINRNITDKNKELLSTEMT